MIPPQQTPEGFGVALDPVRPADDQDGIVQHLQGPLHLGGKIHMPRGVQQGDPGIPLVKNRLLGKNRDAPAPFQAVGVQECVLVIHPAQTPDAARPVEQGLGQGGFARVHMGQYPHHQLFFLLFHLQRGPLTAAAPPPPGAGPGSDRKSCCKRPAPGVPAPQKRRSSRRRSPQWSGWRGVFSFRPLL